MESVELHDIGTRVFSGFDSLLSLDNSGQLSGRRHIVNEEQRFRLWAHSLGLHQQGHSSLDYRVRDAVVVKDRLAKILSKLQEHLENLLAIGKGERRPFEDVEIEEDTDDEDSIKDEMTHGATKHSHSDRRSSFREVEFRLHSLTEGLDALYSLATKIRNPRNRPQRPNGQLYRHIPARDRVGFVKEREEAEIAVIAYAQRQQLIESANTRGAVDLEVGLDGLISQYATTTCWLVRRVGIANARRKQQFVYWQDHALRLSSAPAQNGPATSTAGKPSQDFRGNELPISPQKGLTPNVAEERAASAPAPAPSAVTSASRLSANFMKTDDMKSVVSSQSRVSTVMNLKGEKLEWPSPPAQISINNRYFTCPYCKILCPQRYLKRDAWRIHLIHDLQPYHCTYENCQDPHRLYGTRRDWFNHESQHAQVWHCQGHGEEFKTEPDYVEHLRVAHPEAKPEHFSPELISTSIGPSQKPHRDCPFCPSALSTASEIEKHIVFHLERFALLALPLIEDNSNRHDHSSNSHIVQHHGRRNSVALDFSDSEKESFATISHPVNNQDHAPKITESTLRQEYPVENTSALESWLRDERFQGDAPPSGLTVPEEDFPSEYNEASDKLIKRQARRLGLDDSKRIRQICDRGEEDFHRAKGHTSQRNAQPKIYESTEGNVTDLIKTIELELDFARVHSILGSGGEYLPRDRLPLILTPERIRTLVDTPCFSDYPDKNKLTTDIYFGSDVLGPCLRLLAVLIGIEKITDFPKCLADEMSDRCLPMVAENSGGQKTALYCRYHKRGHRIINEYRRPDYRRRFMQWSYSVLAPYLVSDETRHSHYVLDASDIFPMNDGGKIQRSEFPGDNYQGATNMLSRYGGFSDVYRVRIENSHYNFADTSMRHPGGFFALKKLHSHDRTNFNLELASLLFAMDTSSGKTASNHLIRLLVTFEVQHPPPQAPVYYLLFDWAEGNLNDFWRANYNLVMDMRHCRWMSQQFHGICLALQCVHNQHMDALSSIVDNRGERDARAQPAEAESLYGRHGDIKPDNFLWFRRENHDPGQLALSDFGLGRLHTQESRSNQNPRDLSWTATYRAPEFDLPTSVISRASDIFNLGCVFLEYVTWLLLGIESVEIIFPDRRASKDIHNFLSDTFFDIRLDKDSGKQLPFLKDSVKDWIIELQENNTCSRYLYQLLEIIRDKMLVPDCEKRINVVSLITEMDILRRRCEVDETFYMKSIKES